MGMLFVIVVEAVLALVAGTVLAAGALIDINTADQKTLERLPEGRGRNPSTSHTPERGGRRC